MKAIATLIFGGKGWTLEGLGGFSWGQLVAIKLSCSASSLISYTDIWERLADADGEGAC